MLAIANPFEVFHDKSGDPLDAGYIYIGTVDLNPETSPVTVYWDEAGTQPAEQPLRTLNGYIVRSGTPARVYVGADDFSMTCKEKNGVIIFYERSVESVSNLRNDITDPVSPIHGAGFIPFNTSLAYPAGSIGSSLIGRGRLITDSPYGAVPGEADSTSKIQAALNAGGLVIVPPGTFNFTRLYMQYSNTWLVTMPGAVLQQITAGIVNSNTAGQDPAYAAIHIHPLNYKAGGGVSLTKISNVRVRAMLRGPYTVAGAYNGFSMGVVSNDCDDCHIEDGDIAGFRGENVLHAPASFNVVNNVTIKGNKIRNGGEVGVNKASGWEIVGNDVAESWVQNGVGGSGANGEISGNVIREMAQGGMTIGGSGIGSGKVSMQVYGNKVSNTGVTLGGYAVYLSDDGATSVVKDIDFYDNNISGHSGSVGVAADFASASSVVRLGNNVIQGIDSVGGSSGFEVIAGNATYITRNNTVTPDGANQNRGFDVSGGTPVILMRGGDYIYGHSLNDVQGPGDFIIGEYMGTSRQITHIRPVSFQSGVEFKRLTLTYGATVTPQSDGGLIQRIPVTDAAAFTVAPASGSLVGPIFIQVVNTSGGAHGAITWTSAGSGGYLMSAGVTVPNGQRITIGFAYNGTFWEEISRSAAV